MSFWNFFNFFKTDEQPPPYAAEEPGPNTRAIIQHSDTPQWEWTQSQCRAWLHAVMSHYFELDADMARVYATHFEGAGPNLYLYTFPQWSAIMGTNRAAALYSMIATRGNNKGGVPKGYTITSSGS